MRTEGTFCSDNKLKVEKVSKVNEASIDVLKTAELRKMNALEFMVPFHFT